MESAPHVHTNCETAMFVLAGPVLMRHGSRSSSSTSRRAAISSTCPRTRRINSLTPSESEEAAVVLCRNAAEEIVREL